MRRWPVGLVAAASLVASAGCAPFIGPSSSDPPCNAADGVNVYVDQGARAGCQLQVGQRFVVKMPRSQGTDDSLRIVCLNVWRGREFIINYGALDYCVFLKRFQ